MPEFMRCECAKNVSLSQEVSLLEFRWTGERPAAGQFFMLRPRRTGVFLGRPISVARCQGDMLRFLVLRKGEGTRDLMDLKPGEEADLTGPLGNSWESFRKKLTNPEGRIALISGGVGIAPLVCYADELPQGSYDFYAGFKSEVYGLEDARPQRLVVATEDGSYGERGRIPDFLKGELPGYGAVFACGPEAMLRSVAESCALAGTRCLISLERRMACGVGACLGCSVNTRGGKKRCCADGPIFTAEDIIFE